MSKYVLSCKCGKSVAVDAGQAGGSVVCACGERLDVPALRNLRHLPVAEPEAGGTRSARAAWDARKGLAAASFILAVLLAGFGAWDRFKEPLVPKFDAEVRQTAVNEGLEKMSPLESWNMWVGVYRPMSQNGFQVFEHPHQAAIEQHIASRRTLQKSLFVVAGVFALIGLAAAFWPKPRVVPVRRR